GRFLCSLCPKPGEIATGNRIENPPTSAATNRTVLHLSATIDAKSVRAGVHTGALLEGEFGKNSCKEAVAQSLCALFVVGW
ncbi:MAG TPA: hypothetical protein VGM80_00590, partial [Gaiellaceae bacterium]